MNGTTTDRLLNSVRAIVHDEIRALVGFPAVYEYSIANTDGSTTVDVVPTSDVGLPALNKVPLRASTIGALKPATGKLAHVVFLDGDLRRPVCTWCEPDAGNPVAREGDNVNAGYLVQSTIPPALIVGYFPGTTIGAATAAAIAAALSPPGLVIPMGNGKIDEGSEQVSSQ